MAGVDVSPEPTDEEAVAIAAALRQVLFSGGAATVTEPPNTAPAWRFSGRWWNKPTPIARQRPLRR